MAKNKSSVSKSPNWGKLGGPSGKMAGFRGVGTQVPGQTAQAGSGGRRDMKPQAGGSGKMAGNTGAQRIVPGKTAR